MSMNINTFGSLIIRPASNGIIVEPERDANEVYNTMSLMVFTDFDELVNYIKEMTQRPA